MATFNLPLRNFHLLLVFPTYLPLFVTAILIYLITVDTVDTYI